ncbi:DMT family transporter [Kordiimonas marina]|uniref:DMT family transporter n=1 Tax=Kordiimonas marina TaxID=2872312 RepID=UPI001FF2FF9C|nr:DMT family transporter [Kordiimonas marina]MCJ9428297.1 DMT family transporter [Kordiimonas marina]
MSNVTSKDMKTGLAAGLGAAIIWGGWPIVTALGVTGDFSPLMIVLLRFTVAGLILLPFAFRGPMRLKDWGQALAMTAAAGAGYTLTVAEGLTYAPAAHAGLLIPSAVMVFSLIGGHFILGDRISRNRALGALFILAGIGGLALSAADHGTSLRGDLLFLMGGLMWASFGLMLKKWQVNARTATARISLISAILLLPVLVAHWPALMALPTKELVLQAVWQGVVSSIVAVLLFGRAIATLGTGRASVLNTATPAVSLVLSILILGAHPGPAEWLGLAFIFTGMVTALGLNVRSAFAALKRRTSRNRPMTPVLCTETDQPQ